MKKLTLMALLAAGSALASPVLSFNPAAATAGAELNQTVGWQFTVLNSISVTGLGWFDQNNDGLFMAHTVGIWNDAGTLLVSALVPQGVAAPLDGQFRTTSFAAVVLAPGTYSVGGQNFSTNTEILAFKTPPTTIASISFGGGLFSPEDGIFERPILFTGEPNCCWGPSFSITTGSEAVPEPATALPVLGTLAAAWFFVRRRRNA